MMKHILILLATTFLLLSGALLGTGCGSKDAATPITGAELAALIEDGSAPLILDVRTTAEYAQGHIPGAMNIPHTELGKRLSELGVAKSDEIVVHCQSGRRAQTAESILRENGYTKIRDLTGHWQGWTAAKLPTVSGNTLR
ncbi:MAG: rhodanese-like domain-containing protein [Candidatus Eisenbacteria bacterium]|uniref:Rhodanese-like domain-containing protein n=1 Tax=Eiseniibacteriota bacterium TaxID=2212470 RepID=A0A7Y2E975_UNCEI|nr:rhodanese-like domain-containing protein [Candidatus Eisenbacteria bacterium]